jgi:hypothetical protein
MNTQSVHTGEVSASTISPQYGKLYDDLQGDKKPFFTGELSGSVVNVNQYFEDDFNPYDGDWNVYNSQHTISQSINMNSFLHSDWNVLLNNVSKSVESNIRRHIEYIYGTTGSITNKAELQDSYLTLRSYQISRYEGSKTTSLLYNTYTSASYTGSDGLTIVTGDDSFGKTAAIDHNVRKIGLFTQIEESRYLPTRNNISLKYLVDEFGGLTELNQRNKHWAEIQNTFIANEISNISLFDNKKFGNQKFTDGDKLIFDSGYFYSPILYFASCSVDPSLSFLNLNSSNAYLGKAINSLSTGSYISGSSTLGYPLVASGSVKVVSKLFDQVTQGSAYLTPGTATLPPTYSVQETGDHNMQVSVPFTIEVPSFSYVSSSWALQVFKNGNLLYQDVQTFTFGDPANTTLTFVNYDGVYFNYYLSNPISSQELKVRNGFIEFYQTSGECNIQYPQFGSAYQTTDAIFNPGNTIAVGNGNGNTCPLNGYSRKSGIQIYTDYLGGWVYVQNNSTVQITAGTSLLVIIDQTCLQCV